MTDTTRLPPRLRVVGEVRKCVVCGDDFVPSDPLFRVCAPCRAMSAVIR